MHVSALAWQFVLLLIVLLAIRALVSAIRGDVRNPAFLHPLLIVALMPYWVVGAVSGSAQPSLERVAKGVIAVLLASTLAVAFPRLRRRRRQTDGVSATEPARTGSTDDAATSTDHAGSPNAPGSTATAP